MKRFNKRSRYIIIVVLISVLVYVLVNAISIIKYSKVDEKHTADTVIVLGAGTYKNKLTPVFRERVNHSIWLYQNGYADSLILTGGYSEGNEHSDAFIAKEYAVLQGIPEKDILIEEKSTITQENIEYAKSIMESNSYDTAVLVSDPLHMKRAMLMANDYGIKAYSSPTPTTMYVSLKSKIPFLARELFFYIGYKMYRVLW